MTGKDDCYLRLKELFDGQRLAVLSSQQEGQPYANLIAFSASSDLGTICFATPRNTRKYDNLKQDGRVALLIDSRENQGADFTQAVAATAIGRGAEVNKDHEMFTSFLSKHPELNEFARDENIAFFCVHVDSYVFVDHFQHVTEIEP